MSQEERPFIEKQLPVPWGHIAAKVYGSSHEKKILAVHGHLDNAGTFNRLIGLLPEGYQYVVIDLPGHGYSSYFPPGLPLNFLNYVYTLKIVLKALGWDTCIYMGHSLGAQIGVYFSVLYPGKFEKIIALDGLMPFPTPDNFVYHVRQQYDLDSYGHDSGIVYSKEQVLHALKFRRSETLNSDAAEALFTRAVTKVGDSYKYNRDPRLRTFNSLMNLEQHKDFLEKLSTPILVLVALNSRRLQLMSTALRILDAHLKGRIELRIVYVQGNHDVHNNNPENVAPHICEFLSKIISSKL